jgi:outer membrane lipoprotein-sorting protein
LKINSLACTVLATLALVSCGGTSAVRKTIKNAPGTTPIVKDATREELIESYNSFAQGVKTINSTVELKPTAGSRYSGLIQEYHEVKAFLLASRPDSVRMIGQAPVIGTTVFDMASDSDTFRVSIPSKNKFLVGPVSLERTSSKPIENLRPQHLLDALLWPEIRKGEAVLFEEFNDENARYYVLTVLRGGYEKEVSSKIWFDRADLHVVRLQKYGPKGALLSDAHFSDWEPLVGDQEHTADTPADAASFPRTIQLNRPHDDYTLDLQVTKLTLNGDIPADRFKIEQPAGSELVRVGEDSAEKKP